MSRRIARGCARGTIMLTLGMALAVATASCQRQRAPQIPRASIAPEIRREVLDGFAARIKVGQSPDLRGRTKQFYLFGADAKPATVSDASWALVVGQPQHEVEAFESVFKAGLNVPQFELVERRFSDMNEPVYLMEWIPGVTIPIDKIGVGLSLEALKQTLRGRLAPVWAEVGLPGGIPATARMQRALSDLRVLRASSLALEDVHLQFSARVGAVYVIDPHIDQDAQALSDRSWVLDAIEAAITAEQ